MRNPLKDRYTQRFQPRTNALSSAFVRQIEHQSRHRDVTSGDSSRTPQSCGELIASSELPDMSIYAQRSQNPPGERVNASDHQHDRPVNLKTLKYKNEVGLVLKHSAPVIGHGSNSAGVAQISPRQQRLISQAAQFGGRSSGLPAHNSRSFADDSGIPDYRSTHPFPSSLQASDLLSLRAGSRAMNADSPGSLVEPHPAHDHAKRGDALSRELHQEPTLTATILTSSPKGLGEQNTDKKLVPNESAEAYKHDSHAHRQPSRQLQSAQHEHDDRNSTATHEVTLQERLAFIRQRKAEQAALRKTVLD